MKNTKNNKINAAQLWKQFEDLATPRLRLSTTDRSVYSYLLRHSHLEGKTRLLFSIQGLSRHLGLSTGPVRDSVRRLVEHRALRLLQRSKAGHLVDVRLPEQIPALRGGANHSRDNTRNHLAATLEQADFLQSRARRQSIYERDRGRCFYCLGRLGPLMKCIDHVVPRARRGRNSYRNLVACCVECNSHKGETAAQDFLRRLYRDGRLTAADLRARLRALHALAAGKLRPALAAPATPRQL